MLENDYEEYSRIVMIGDSCVGKTSLLNRLVQDSHNPNEMPTIGAVNLLYRINVGDDTVTVNIWDTAGQEKYRSLAPIYFRNSTAAVIVFDITSFESFSNIEKWYISLLDVAPSDVIVVLAGNKCDLINESQVSHEQIDGFIRERQIPYFSTSAKDGQGVYELFAFIGKEIISRKKKIFLGVSSLPTGKASQNSNVCC